MECVGRTFTAEAKNSIEELNMHKFPQPTIPQVKDSNNAGVIIDKTEQGLSYIDKIMIQSQIKEWMIKQKKSEVSMSWIFSIVHGQCMDAKIQKLKAKNEYSVIKLTLNPT